MSVIMLLVIMGIIGAIAFGAVVVVPLLAGSQKKELREARQKLVLAAKKERVADKALRSIKNDAGNPALEASIALDEIFALDNTDIKELN